MTVRVSSGVSIEGSADGRYGPMLERWRSPRGRGDRWGTGFLISSPPHVPMLGPRSFGHPGAGGQLAFADDEHALGFAYVNNQMGGVPDHRARLLVEALQGCLGR